MNDAGWAVNPATVSIADWWKYHDGAEQEIKDGGYYREQFEEFMPQLQIWIDNQRAGGASANNASVDRMTRIRTMPLVSYPNVVTSQKGGGKGTTPQTGIPEV